MKLQILDWDFVDIILDNDISNDLDSDEEDEEEYKNSSQFTIRIFGRTSEGESVSVLVTDFIPFFYIKVYDSWKKNSLDGLNSYINKFLSDLFKI